MFDGDWDTCYHSKCKKDQGVSIKFKSLIELENVRIITRKSWRDVRYRNLCLFADGAKVACTPDDYRPPHKLEFANLGSLKNIIAKEFKLIWMTDNCAQIPELDIIYKDAQGKKTIFFSKETAHFLVDIWTKSLHTWKKFVEFSKMST